MVRHVVMFRLGGEDAERRAVAEKFCEALRKLPALIPELVDMEAGVNINPAEEWDVTLVATARSLDDVAAYSVHPAHVEAVGIISHCKEARACVDYFTD